MKLQLEWFVIVRQLHLVLRATPPMEHILLDKQLGIYVLINYSKVIIHLLYFCSELVGRKSKVTLTLFFSIRFPSVLRTKFCVEVVSVFVQKNCDLAHGSEIQKLCRLLRE